MLGKRCMHGLKCSNRFLIYVGAGLVLTLGTGCGDKPSEPVGELAVIVEGEGAAARRKVLVADWSEAGRYGEGVTTVKTLATTTIDEDLVFVEGLPHLDRLDLADSQVTDRTLERIREASNLSVFVLSRVGVSDAGLPFLGKQAPIISTLYLDGTGVTDAGMVHLKGMINLLTLDLTGTVVSDAGLASLAGLTNIQTLKLSRTGVTGRGLVHLRGMTRMVALDLTNTEVDDTGMVHLQRMTKLSHLDLANTKVTDRGLEYLIYLRRLQTLNLTGTEVTEGGVGMLEANLDDVKVIIDAGA